MKIWHLKTKANDFENLGWDDSVSIDEIRSYDGRSKKENWKPVRVKRLYDRNYSNTPSLSSHVPVFDKVAVNTMKSLISKSVEILPLLCEDGEFFAINVINVIDCIDYDNSSYEMYDHGKRIMCFNKYAFIEEKVKGKHIFKIIDEPRRSPFVSDEFKKLVEESNLTGFKFVLVWDSEA